MMSPDGIQSVRIFEHAEVCPHCGRLINPKIIEYFYISSDVFDVVYKCIRKQCERIYVGNFRSTWTVDGQLFKCYRVLPENGHVEARIFDDVIAQISPGFIEIYNEAFIAEHYDLLHIAGMGYRKSLEFLIKDYAALASPDNESIIKNPKTTLSKVIKEFVSDPRLVMSAERAAWLGNDETHYVRKWEDKDITDL
ncbi:hypothetical protein D3C77_443970 [compost metagenome]